MSSREVKLSSKSKIQIALLIVLLVVLFIFHFLMTNNIVVSFIEILPYFVVLYFLYENFKSRDVLHLMHEQPSKEAANYKIKKNLQQSKKKMGVLLTIGLIGISILFLVVNDKYAVARLLTPLPIASSATYDTVKNYGKLLYNQQ